MNIRKLGQLATFTSGELITRIQEHGTIDTKMGDYQLFAVDREGIRFLHSNESFPVVNAGQLILGLIQQRIYAPPTTEPPVMLTANFAAVKVTEALDSNFFAWWFNDSEESNKQKYQISQSANMTLNRLTMQDVRKMHITLPPITVQRELGRLYLNQRNQIQLLQRRAILVHQRAQALIMKRYGGASNDK